MRSPWEDRKRVLRGKPLPGSLKPLPKKARSTQLPALTIATDDDSAGSAS